MEVSLHVLQRIKHEEKGLIGIGTLIVFISMVIISAVAGGVLINTATALQGQARQTGTMAMQQVSSGVRVVKITGRSARENGETIVENMQVLVKLRAGSQGIDLRDLTIEYLSEDADTHLSMTENAYGSREGLFQYENIGENNFGVVKVRNASNSENCMLGTMADLIEIWVDVSAIEDGISPSEEATLALIPNIGVKTYATARAPPVMRKKGVYRLRL